MKSNTSVHSQLQQVRQTLQHLRIPLFLLLLAIIYGFIVWRVSTLTTAQPDPAAVASQSSSTSKPYIDPATIDKIKQLEDNSVTVRALFDQARQNPFRE